MKVFQSFRLDTVNHCLWRAGARVSLAPKAFDVLRYLVEHPGRVITQNELLEALWSETYVNPEVIKKYILEIRKVLGDDPTSPVFIENFPKRGYQFIAIVREEAAAGGSSDLRPYPTKKMVGRDTALRDLERYLDQALNGRRQLIFVTGEAGIGKTMLVDAFHQQASSFPYVRVARGQCVEGFGGKEPYYPMLEALGQLLRDPSSSPAAQTLAQVAPTWWVQFPSLLKADAREALQREILGATRTRMVREICEALEALTAEQPLVLIFEDLHWVDPSTLDLISALARRREQAKLMLLGTYRPADVALFQSQFKWLRQDLQAHQLCEEIALERLEESAIGEYLSSEFPKGNLPSALSNFVFRHSGGNALFMTAIVQEMVKKELIVEVHGRWELTQSLEGIAPDVPDSLHQMLEGQFEQLSPMEQRVLKSASVTGEHFSVWAIASTLEIEPEKIEDLCEKLAERQQFIKSLGIQELANTLPSPCYEFRHAVYRQAIYKRLSVGNRSRLHRSLGERFGALCTPEKPDLASEVAFHFEQGHDYEKAFRYFVLAAANATRKFAHRNAIQILEHARNLILSISSGASPDYEIKLLELIGQAHYAVGEVAEAAEAFGKEVTRASQAGLKRAEVDASIRLAYAASPTNSKQGIAASENAVQLSNTLNDSLLLARTQILAASFRILHDRWSQKDADILAANLEIVRSSGAPIPFFHEMLYASQAQIVQGQYTDALQILKANIPVMGQASGLTPYLSSWGGILALLHTGQLGESLTVLRTVLETAKKNGNDLWPGAFMGLEAWLRTSVSDFNGALRLCESILQTFLGRSARTPRVVALLSAGHAELGLGNPDRARFYYDQVKDMSGEQFYLYWYWRMHAVLGSARAWLQSGNVSNARTQSSQFLQFALSISDPSMQVLAWEITARIALAEQDLVSAEQPIQAALRILETRELPLVAWQLHSTACEFFRLLSNTGAAELHRGRAEKVLLALAASFSEDEPLRAVYLASDAVRRVLGNPPTDFKTIGVRKHVSNV
jgi:DNA-binding winged helix-turn-helix (wHTH) protein/tetratricopeptide (TPR) repeat protein